MNTRNCHIFFRNYGVQTSPSSQASQTCQTSPTVGLKFLKNFWQFLSVPFCWKNFSLLACLTAALVFLSCSSDRNTFTLSGRFKGLEQGEFICFSSAPEWGTLDTVRIQGGKFSLSHPLADTVVLTLQYPNFMQTQVVAIPGHEVTIKGDANNMLAINVGSDDENEALNEFRHSIADLRSQTSSIKSQTSSPALVRAAEQFIRQNPESWASIAVFQKYILQAEHPDYALMAKLLDEMAIKCPGRRIIQQLRAELGSLLACRVGSRLPAFSAVTLRGDTVSNATFRGKPLLITLWSTMAPEHTYLLVASNRVLRRNGQWSIANGQRLNICLDADTSSCMRTLRRDSIGGYTVCDLRTFESPLVKNFGLRTLPSNIFVDSNGIIRERDISVDKLEATLGKYLK